MDFRQARGQAARLYFMPRNRKNAGLLQQTRVFVVQGMGKREMRGDIV